MDPRSYRPVIKLRKRKGKISVWVNMPNGDELNIWDLEKVNKETADAIGSAFERGMIAMGQLFSCCYIAHPDCDMEIKEEYEK